MKTRRNNAAARPTWTSLVLAALVRADDFCDMDALVEATKGSRDQIGAALFHLQKQHVVDAVEGNGRLWWFATGDDDRRFTVEERVPEAKGSRTRGHSIRRPDEGERS